MSDAQLPPQDDQALDAGDDTLPPEHPAGSDSTVSAGEVLSGEGVGTGTAGSVTGRDEPTRDAAPGDDA